MNMVKVEIVCRETIKPSSSTPNDLRNCKLSLIDQLSPPVYVPMIFYYSENDHDYHLTAMEKIQVLKKSLSETLTRFYPFAGKIRENMYIECNDEGIDCFEAKVSIPLSQVLNNPETCLLDQLLPRDYHFAASLKEVQVAIQLNTFTCGGIAIGINFSHKIMDTSTVCSFMNTWSSIACGRDSPVDPAFIGAYLFPPRDLSGVIPKVDMSKNPNLVTKRFVIEGSKIDAVRGSMKSTDDISDQHISRTILGSALIWKCAMNVSKFKLGYARPSVIRHAVNLRWKSIPRLPDNSFGNILWMALAVASPPEETDGEIDLNDLVGMIRNAIREFDGECVRKMRGEDGFLTILESWKGIMQLAQKFELYNFSSLVNFPLYEADFGWGNPVWISAANLQYNNRNMFFSTKSGDGIEAWVTLDKEEMPIFEKKFPELLQSIPR